METAWIGMDRTGARIRIARQQANISQTALAKTLGIGRSSIANWECNLAKPSTTHLQHVAKVTGVAFEWLATGKELVPTLSASHPETPPKVENHLSEAERQLVTAYRHAPKRQQKHILHVVLSLSTATAATLKDLLPLTGL